ncbi:MAG: lipocalin family protein [Cytophagales bacterium]|nr:lipocalin family protein [Cytophagales bacterium]
MLHRCIFFLAVLSVLSCKKDADIDPVNIQGKWNVDSAESKIEYNSSSPDNTNIDLSSEGLYFDFKSDGTYSTNAELGIGNISAGEQINTDTYSIEGNRLKIAFVETDLKIPIILLFDIELNGTNLNLKMDRNDLLDSYEEIGGKLDIVSKSIFQLLLSEVIKIEYTIQLSQ